MDETTRKLERAWNDAHDVDSWLAWGYALAKADDDRGSAILALVRRASRFDTARARWLRLGEYARKTQLWESGRRGRASKLQTLCAESMRVRLRAFGRAYRMAMRLHVAPSSSSLTGDKSVVGAFRQALEALVSEARIAEDDALNAEVDQLAEQNTLGDGRPRCDYPTRSFCPHKDARTVAFRHLATGRALALNVCRQHQEMLSKTAAKSGIQLRGIPTRTIAPEAVADAISFILGSKVKYEGAT